MGGSNVGIETHKLCFVLLPDSTVHQLGHSVSLAFNVWRTVLLIRRQFCGLRTQSAGVGNNPRDIIKTSIISFITITLTGEPNSPFSFNLPNGSFGLVGPYLVGTATMEFI